MKYVYAISPPKGHVKIQTPAGEFVAVGQVDQDALRGSGEMLARVFARPFAVAQIFRQTEIGPGLARRRWILRLTGLPRGIYEEPRLLEAFVDDALALCAIAGARADRHGGPL